jgi:trbC/VIRB2 family
MKKAMKICTVLLIAVLMITFATNVFAADVRFDQLTPNYQGDSSGLVTKATNVMGLIRNIAIIASVIILMVLGVKYMLGSVEEKAEYKKSFIPLIIGIILVVSATTIASFIFGMAS